MDAVLYDNKGDMDIDWYKAVNIFSIQIQNEFLYQGISNNADVIHEEDYDHTVETTFFGDKTIQISNLSINNIDKIKFYDHSHAQSDRGTKCLVTSTVDILQNVLWYDEKNKTPVHMRSGTSV